MVALYAGRLGGLSVAELLIRKHGFAYMYTAVVYKVDLHDVCTAGLEDLAHALTNAVVPYMPKVQRLIGIGAAELNHDLLGSKKVRVSVGSTACLYLPIHLGDDAVHVDPYVHVRAKGERLSVRLVCIGIFRDGVDPGAQFLGKDVWSLGERLCIRKERKGKVSHLRFWRDLQHDRRKHAFMSAFLVHPLQGVLNQTLPFFLVYHFKPLFLTLTSPVERTVSCPSSHNT